MRRFVNKPKSLTGRLPAGIDPFDAAFSEINLDIAIVFLLAAKRLRREIVRLFLQGIHKGLPRHFCISAPAPVLATHC